MKTLRCAMRLMVRTWRAWLLFELLFQLLSLSIAGPALKLSLDGAMALGGYTYLTWENVKAFALSPVTIVFVVVWALVFALSSVFNLAGLHYALSFGGDANKAHLMDTVRYAARRVRSVAKPRNLAMVPYLVVLLPLTNLGTTAGVVRSIELPEFIMEYVETNPVLGGAYLLVMLCLSICVLRYVFCSVFFVARDCSFAEAMREARRVGKGHALADTVRVILLPSLLSMLYFLPLLALFLVAILLGGSFGLWMGIFVTSVMLVGLLTSAPISYATCLAILRMRDACPERPERPAVSANGWVTPLVSALVLVASLAGGTYFVVQNFVGPLQTAKQLGERDMLLTAHRGGTFAAPENTMAAFVQAKADGADVCEIDVQQSKDGVIFVSHDSNFLRISGVDKGAWELSWEEISKLDATGSYWEGRVEPQGYPLLDDVVAWAAQNDMQLNIELKPTGHETDFEQAVVDIVNAHDFGKSCVVTSQAYDTVARVEELNPDITSIYVTTLAYGALWELDAVDGYSLEENSATALLVSNMHQRGKQVFAWVVNSDANMRSMAANGVDNLITDDVPLGREVVDETNSLTPAWRVLYAVLATFV